MLNKKVKIPEIELFDIETIYKNPKNPRTIKNAAFKKLVKSINDFPEMLYIRPVVIDSSNIILGGNMRYDAAKSAGLSKIPVILADSLTEDQKKEFIIKDNISGGEWNWDQLTNEWNVEQLVDWGLEVNIENNKNSDNSDNDNGLNLKEMFKIEIDCNDELTQEKVYNEMIERGYKCRLLTL